MIESMPKFSAVLLTVLAVGVLTVLLTVLAACSSTRAAAADKELKVLMVGNSFAWSCRRYLPEVAKSVPGCTLKLEIAHIGGCYFERHMKEYARSMADPKHHPYLNIEMKWSSLPDLLKKEKWDIISIQQASPMSWRAETYQPWADQLIALIRETNPQAEIIVQETWSYNDGDPRIHGTEGTWGITQQGMYDKLAANYRKLAEDNHFRIVPMGLAVQLSRADHPKQLPVMTPEFQATFRYPAALPQTEDMVGSLGWGKEIDGVRKISVDMIHLNRYGDYMQACLWFAFLFDRKVDEIPFRPEGMDPARLDKARRCAQEALDTYQQVK